MGQRELSVIIPTYGRTEQVTRAVASALVQDIDLEIVVVDDGSPAPLRLEQDPARVRIVRLERNQGAAAARNAGIVAASADWIAFLDSDDVWTPGTLRGRFERAQRAPDPAGVIWACGFADVWPSERRTTRIPRTSSRAEDFASGCWSCPGSTALFARSAWTRSGGQDSSLRRLEDYDWLLRWGAAGGSLCVDDVIGAEISRGGRAKPQVIDAAAAAIRAKHAGAAPDLRRRMESYLALESAAARLAAGDLLGGGLALARSFALKPRAQLALEPFWKMGG